MHKDHFVSKSYGKSMLATAWYESTLGAVPSVRSRRRKEGSAYFPNCSASNLYKFHSNRRSASNMALMKLLSASDGTGER
jgi:hypothetical protein